MEKGEPFSKICSGIKESIEQSLDEQRPILLKTAKSIFDKILKDFDLMFVVEELPDPRRNILRRQVQQFVLSANEKYHGTIVNEFAKATMGTTWVSGSSCWYNMAHTAWAWFYILHISYQTHHLDIMTLERTNILVLSSITCFQRLAAEKSSAALRLHCCSLRNDLDRLKTMNTIYYYQF